jgi:hypothetical protein
VHIPTLVFAVLVTLFLIGIIVSAVRINVMAELEESESTPSNNPAMGFWDLSAGVAESSGDAIDGQQ